MFQKTSFMLFLVVFLGTDSTAADSAPADTARVQQTYGRLPLYFVENQGQIDNEDVAYYVKGADKTLYFTPEGVTFTLRGKTDGKVSRWTVTLDFVDANPGVKPRGEERQKAVFSYFKGKKKDWKTGLPTFSRIVYEDLWPGIDLVYSGGSSFLKYEFVVEAGADPGQVRMSCRGAANVSVTDAGALLVETPIDSFEDGVPYAYQIESGENAEVQMRYSVARTGYAAYVYGFEIGPYDAEKPLFLDPSMLIYCGYIGGAKYDEHGEIAVDAEGNSYVAGVTLSTENDGFPLEVGPDPTHNGDYDAFVAKVNVAGDELVYCGYLGGSGEDSAQGVAVDPQGYTYVTGYTNSEYDFPVYVGPDLTYNGGYHDAFVAKVNADGVDLIYCGFIGGNLRDSGTSVFADTQGKAYITGITESSEATFPVNTGPDVIFNGWRDAFVAKVIQTPDNQNPSDNFDYCGYIGGTGEDCGFGIAVDGNDNAYISGRTYSSENDGFPVKNGPDLTYNGGEYDAIVVKINAAGTELDYCGYIGGAGWEESFGIAVNPQGNAYVVGWTDSTESSFPLTVGPDLSHNGGGADVFVAKVEVSPDSPIPTDNFDFCGYIGGVDADWGYGVAIDTDGSAYVTGVTRSSEASFPTVIGPVLTHGGGNDVFVAKLRSDGTRLVYSGFIGGVGSDSGYGIAVDIVGNAYVAGTTESDESSFPVSVGPCLVHNGEYDAFVAKVSAYEGPDLTIASMSFTPASLDPNTQVTITYTVENIGPEPCGATSRIGFYLSQDDIIDPTSPDIMLGEDTVPDLMPGGTHTVTDHIVNVGNHPGNWYLGGYIDWPDYIVESNEINNGYTAGPITINSLWPDVATLSKQDGGQVLFELKPGIEYGSRICFLLGSMSGTSPGTTLPGGNILPLNKDPFFDYILQNYNGVNFIGFRGFLNPSGDAFALFDTRGQVPLPVATVLHFAFTTEFPYDFQSNPVEIDIID